MATVKYTYAILQETSGEECESWLNFIRYQGNEEALAHLEKQLDQVEWYIVDDLSTFDVETKFLVSEQTAKEMTKVDLNHCSFHRKFDGVLQKIDLKFKPHYDNEKKIKKATDILGNGGIENFIDKEDIDPEDMADSSSSSSSESEKSEDEKPKESKPEPKKDKKFDIPRKAQAKQRRK